MGLKEEIFYHIFQRSFFDTNGDRNGDLKGIEYKLDYIQDLGCTSILLTPLYKSIFYHNYFADDFRGIDETYGSLDDLISLIKAVHSRNMKIYLDMEVQYITEHHEWYKDALNNPNSEFSEYMIFRGPNNSSPESIIFNLEHLDSYDGQSANLTTLNLNNTNVRNAIEKEFLFWLDITGDGSTGVDGYRIDHMMDDLDDKGILTNLLESFWYQIIAKAKEVNPNVVFIGEQGNWDSHPNPYFERGQVDAMCAFDLMFAIRNLDKTEIINSVQYWTEHINKGHHMIFIENHDTDRVSSYLEEDLRKLRIVCIFNIFLPGTPIIYYGQELGLTGGGGFQTYGNNDGNDIPRRRFFPWNSNLDSEGHALWYKETGPWWEVESIQRNLEKSLESQKEDINSLYNFYKRIVNIRSRFSQINSENFSFQETDDNILSFKFIGDQQTLFAYINLSEFDKEIHFETNPEENIDELFTSENSFLNFQESNIFLKPFGLSLFAK